MKRSRANLQPLAGVTPRKLTPAERELVRFLAREFIRQRRAARAGKAAA